MARGKVFLRVQRPAGMSDTDFRTLLVSIGGQLPQRRPWRFFRLRCRLRNEFPVRRNMFFGPIAARRALPFFRTDLVGFQQGAEIQSAAYLINQQLVNFFLISYPTTQIANLRFRSLTHLLDINQGAKLRQPVRKTQRNLCLNGSKRSFRESWRTNLMGRLRVSQQVSWNAPAPGKPITVQDGPPAYRQYSAGSDPDRHGGSRRGHDLPGAAAGVKVVPAVAMGPGIRGLDHPFEPEMAVTNTRRWT